MKKVYYTNEHICWASSLKDAIHKIAENIKKEMEDWSEVKDLEIIEKKNGFIVRAFDLEENHWVKEYKRVRELKEFDDVKEIDQYTY